MLLNISDLNVSCISGFIAISYKKNDIVMFVVSDPANKNSIAGALTFRPPAIVILVVNA